MFCIFFLKNIKIIILIFNNIYFYFRTNDITINIKKYIISKTNAQAIIIYIKPDIYFEATANKLFGHGAKKSDIALIFKLTAIKLIIRNRISKAAIP